MTKRKPDISDLRPFGALGYYKLSDSERNLADDPRWKEKALKGVMLGLAPNVEGGYLIYPGGNRKPIVRKQVLALAAKAALVLPVYSDRFQIGNKISELDDVMTIPQRDKAAADAPRPIRTRSVARSEDEALQQLSERDSQNSLSAASETSPHPHWSASMTRKEAGVGLRRGAVEEACLSASADSEEGPMDSSLPPTPRSLRVALLCPHWTAALTKERDDTIAGGSYEEISYRPERYMNAVLAYRASRQPDGSIKYKARLCPDGSSQRAVIDFDESYSPTVRKESIFMVLHVAAANDWDIKHLDIGTAYKTAPTPRGASLYMRLSQAQRDFGFSKSEFVRLLVNYWGTKEAGRAFHVYLALVLNEFGLQRSGDDPCVFVKIESVSSLRVVVQVFVDDIMVTGGWSSEIMLLVAHLRNVFPEVKMEELAKFVGMQVERDRPSTSTQGR